jgi:hypothetical protein
MDPDDPYSGTFGGEPAGGPSDINAPPPPPQAPAPPPQAAYAQAPAAAQPTTNGLAGLFGLFGSGGLGGGGVTTTAGTPGAAPGMNQSMIGLGLGMLGGNIFNKWGPALRGYQTGAAADLARQQQVNTYGYQQQELGLRRDQMAQTERLERERLGLQRELAYKPQVQFRQNEETGEWEALQYDPLKGTVKNVPIAQADKIGQQEGVNATWYSPITGKNEPYPAGIDTPRARRQFRQDMAKVNSDFAAGKINASQYAQMFYQRWIAPYLPGGGGQTTTPQQLPPKLQGIAKPGEVVQWSESQKRWRIGRPQGSHRFYDAEGNPVQ